MNVVLDRPAVRPMDAARPAPHWWPAELPNPFSLSPEDAVDWLENGSSFSQPEFHLLYSRTPEGFRAELIGGVVHVMSSPVSGGHATPHFDFGGVLFQFRRFTPGVQGGSDRTARLGAGGEAQPDLHLRVRLDHGGRVGTWNLVDGERVPAGDDGDYLDGGPEFVLEIAKSSRRSDLGEKLADYRAGGVKEYVVAVARTRSLVWYCFEESADPLPPPSDGVLKSRAMPGLWIDGPAVFREDAAAAGETADAGLAAPEHAAFVERLAAAKAAGAPAE